MEVKFWKARNASSCKSRCAQELDVTKDEFKIAKTKLAIIILILWLNTRDNLIFAINNLYHED
jgi:hypothetical protein